MSSNVNPYRLPPEFSEPSSQHGCSDDNGAGALAGDGEGGITTVGRSTGKTSTAPGGDLERHAVRSAERDVVVLGRAQHVVAVLGDLQTRAGVGT